MGNSSAGGLYVLHLSPDVFYFLFSSLSWQHNIFELSWLIAMKLCKVNLRCMQLDSVIPRIWGLLEKMWGKICFYIQVQNFLASLADSHETLPND